jgi:ABC-type transport system involved in multi-copper enzyme maturation permease subunit
MGLFAAEHSDKTYVYLLVQPVHRWQILLAKVGMGLLVVVAPFSVTFGLVLATTGSREMPLDLMLFGFVVLMSFSVIMYFWQVLSGLRARRPEVYAAVSLAVLGMWMIQGFLVNEFARGAALESLLWMINPFALVELLDAWTYRSMTEVWSVLLVQCVIAVGLIGAVWIRFERSTESTPWY